MFSNLKNIVNNYLPLGRVIIHKPSGREIKLSRSVVSLLADSDAFSLIDNIISLQNDWLASEQIQYWTFKKNQVKRDALLTCHNSNGELMKMDYMQKTAINASCLRLCFDGTNFLLTSEDPPMLINNCSD